VPFRSEQETCLYREEKTSFAPETIVVASPSITEKSNLIPGKLANKLLSIV